MFLEGRILEFSENGGVGKLKNMSKYVEPSTVRHADDYCLCAFVGRQGYKLAQHWDQHVHAFYGEPELSRKGSLEELLEDLDLRQFLKQTFLVDRHSGRCISSPFDRIAEPEPLFSGVNVFEVESDRRSVYLRQGLYCLEGVACPRCDRSAD